MSQIQDELNKRVEFLSFLDQDINRNQVIQSDIEKKIKSLQETCEHVSELSSQPQHISLIPLCKRLYMPGTIVHCGEYLITTNTYSVLKTSAQTLERLEARIEEQREILEKADIAVNQLVNRKKVLFASGVPDGEDEDEISEEVAAMPNKIQSDRGVAVKVGGYFEIIEHED